MKQITNLQEIEVNEKDEILIDEKISNDYEKETLSEETIKCLLKSEEDIEKGRTRNAREVFKEWKEKCGL